MICDWLRGVELNHLLQLMRLARYRFSTARRTDAPLNAVALRAFFAAFVLFQLEDVCS